MKPDWLFTRQERAALGFVLGAALFGMTVQLLRLDRPNFGPSTSSGLSANGKWEALVSVNRAGEPELVALPGIGPVLAKRVLQDRKLHGRFLTLNDLRRVKGITPKTLERLEGKVRFD